ncbi:MAG: SH3 domain-containing protein, partial [Oscillospiraceae bacterium]|nr:SH3 domain-containing protein [Oscillospiraceae bacterium]
MNFKQRSGFFQRCVATVLAAALFLLPVIALADAGVVTAGYLNLRSAPDEQATVLGSYRSGTRVEVLGSQNGWYKVSVKGKVGYMSARYVSFGSVSGGSQGKTHAVVWSVNGGRVNLRVNPSMDARIITSFPAGQSVEILEKGSYWSRV